MKNSLISYPILFILFVSLCSWGEKAHQKINSSCVEYFPGKIHFLQEWAPFLGDHASDADQRKKTDHNEFVKHFIDMDIYDDFVKAHKIAENFDTACTQYGKEKVMKNGTLPWVTDSTYEALVHNFKTGSWEQAELTAADLGHYVADGYMPLHITANYNGQLSGQKGIHSRYESNMINQYIDSIRFKHAQIHRVKKIKNYIFNYLYANYSYVAILLQADSTAFEMAGKQYNDVYYQKLWAKTNVFTNKLLEESSKTLSRFIYTAWLEAGKPKMPEVKK